jgi:hypothetical protein
MWQPIDPIWRHSVNRQRPKATRKGGIVHDLTASSDQMVRAVLAAIEQKEVIEKAADHLVRAPPSASPLRRLGGRPPPDPPNEATSGFALSEARAPASRADRRASR